MLISRNWSGRWSIIINGQVDIHMDGREIYSILQKSFPDEAALDWDNVGLLCGRMDRNIQRIYVALDADMNVIDDAVKKKADLLLTHHPLIFSGIKRIEAGDHLGGRLLKIIENCMSCYAMHTNYDVKRMGHLAASRLGLKNLTVLEPTTADGREGIGYTGDLEKSMSLRECGVKIKELFNIPDVRIYGNMDDRIKRVSICPGSAKGMEDFALAQGAQVLIGGDFGHHEGLDCLEKHIDVIDAGHYGLEHVFVEDMERFLKENCPGVEIFAAPIVYPFHTI